MRSALYYPHTEITSKSTLATALLLWDQIRVIVPDKQYKPSYGDREMAEAFEVIGVAHCPRESEKKEVHELIEDFATRPLPEAFTYRSVGNPDRLFEIYPPKFLPETWEILQQAGLAADYGLSESSGLMIMGLLSDCCAGKSFARVTDRNDACARLAGLLADTGQQGQATAESQQLGTVSLDVIDPTQIPFEKLLDLRRKEQKIWSGRQLKELRHRYLERLQTEAAKLGEFTKESDIAECKRQFQDDMREDLGALKEELKLEAKATLATKEFMGTVVTAVGTIAAAAALHPVAGVVSAAGTMATIGGLIGTKSKFAQSRRRILLAHPMAYVYEVTAGPIHV